ncbi:MAG: class I SAM-dependent RNA methyltransferase [Rhodospirillales bacterium]|nr:class I SAM-dependent RNA methyltransferase [Rhodospirillales bacterium]
MARIGAEGEGVGEAADGSPRYVRGVLAGETATVIPGPRRGKGRAATLVSIDRPSADRIAPPCPHFGICGGCALQHWREEAYQGWKAGLLAEALARAGFAGAAIAPLVAGTPAMRRRLDFAARRTHRGVALGLHRAGSEEVVDLSTCLVLHPTLQALIAPLRDLLLRLDGLRRAGDAVANLLDDGIDLLLRLDGEASLGDRQRMVAFARETGLLRLSLAGRGAATPEPVAVLRRPVITLSGIAVTPPPGAFLQAGAATEAAIIAAVLAGLPARLKRGPIADLYAGCGTLSCALAARAPVVAFEGAAELVAALRHAAGAQGMAGRITATARDLARQPLQMAELARFSAIVLDPPHAGAAAQVPAIAAARAKYVIYVSCNPQALARDLMPFKAAGYRVTAASPIDQFVFSARLESVVVLEI